MNKKRIFSAFVMVLAIFFISTASASASSETFRLNSSLHNNVSNNHYAIKGDRIYYQVTTQKSRHAVGFGVYRVGAYGQHQLVSIVKTAPAGSGESYGYFDAPSNGSYFLRAACGGNGQTGCQGFGIIDTNW
ncbi:hypothetical protein [Bacillus suaedae]|uniref:Secreted protein n=1 Tax=Halalkalibacter suaedae TaxID=2822140 RepID=A0A940WRC0_9BACI|nr:hypothetical protein [Bacillus suaedae]MBP3950378.1 hypothetical protein [Bacillus suaedae]